MNMMLHPDGNLCIYGMGTKESLWRLSWSGNSNHGPGGIAPMRLSIANDGRLSIFDSHDNELWYVGGFWDGASDKESITHKNLDDWIWMTYT